MSVKIKSEKTQKLVYLAVLTALVIIFQLIGSVIRFGTFSCTLVLMPIVIGAAVCGPFAGAWLGAVFGGMVFLTGDAMLFFAFNPFGTIVIVLLKGILAGLVSGAVYLLFRNKNDTLAVTLSAISAPVVNTGIFLLGCKIFFYDLIKIWAEGYDSVVEYMFLGLAGGNFLLELGINIILCPVIVRLIRIINGKKYDL